MVKWKLIHKGQKEDGSKTFSFETKDKYLNIFSDNGGESYTLRIFKKSKDYEKYDHKLMLRKEYADYKKALKFVNGC
jgi:hypothetical protein